MKIVLNAFTFSLVLASSTCAQTIWTKLSPSVAPSARYGHALVYDSVRAEAVLFGGHDDTQYLNDTWVFTPNGGWVKRSPTLSPSARRWHAMAFDSARSRVVLFGGSSQTSGSLGDTWEWDGTNWSQRTTSTAPAGRSAHAMTFDSVRNRTVLFGGLVGNVYANDTYEFDGTTWSFVAATNQPGGRAYHGLAYDTRRSRTVLYGGANGIGYYGEFQDYNGTGWSVTNGGSGLPIRFAPAMTYDPSRGRTIVHAGRNTSALFDTYEFDGSGLTSRTQATRPFAHYAVRMVYMNATFGTLAFGGGSFPGVSNETWRYHSPRPATFQPFGTGCGPAGNPRLSASDAERPYAGNFMISTVSGLPLNRPVAMLLGSSKASYAGLPLPYDLGVINMPTCSLYTSIDLVIGIPSTSTTASFGVAIPNSAALAGQHFYLQTMVYEPGYNGLGVYLGDAADATVEVK